MKPLCFSEEETSRLKETVDLYIFVKELILLNEEHDPGSVTYLQVLNELRNAYDHLNRVLAVKLGIKEDVDESSYSLTNIDKSLGHVYRACYDSLDWFLINTIEGIQQELKDYTPEEIQAVIPEYYSDIRPKLYEYQNQITELRAKKDIGNRNSDSIERYTAIAQYLQNVWKLIIERRNDLIQIKSSLETIEYIELEMKAHSTEAIKAVIPDYYSTISPKLFKYKNRIKDLHSKKDTTDIKPDSNESYATIFSEIENIRQQIVEKKDALIEYDSKDKEENKKSEINRTIIEIIVGILLLILGYFIGK